ncbi:Bud site selection protein, Revert to axial protein 1 [Clarireedia jacksonii]
MSLCRHYVRELRRSVMIGTPKGDDAQSKRSSAMLENMGDITHPAAGPSMFNTEKERNQDAQMSAFLREQAETGEAGQRHSPSNSFGSHQSANNRGTMSSERQPRASFMSSPMDLTSDSNSPAHTVARADIRASAEKILYTFLLPGAEREIILPHSITHDITISIEERGRDDPEVFDAAKDYVFQAMERDAFPGFLRMKALGNLVPPSMMLRLIIGLLAMFGAFWVAFILIFLDYPRHTRAWASSTFHTLFSPSQLESTPSARISMRSIQFSLSLVTVNTPSCHSLESENLMSANFSTNVHSWSSWLRSSSTQH